MLAVAAIYPVEVALDPHSFWVCNLFDCVFAPYFEK